MNERTNANFARLARIRGFLDLRAHAVADVNRSRARTRLDDVLRSLAELDVTRRSELSRLVRVVWRKHALRDTLLTEHLRPIVEVIRCSELRTCIPASVFKRSKYESDIALIEFARRIADAIGRLRSQFAAEGIDEDSRTQLVTAADELEQVVAEQQTCHHMSTCATAAIADLNKRGCDLARVLNALVVARISRDARLMAEWRAIVAVGSVAPQSDD